MEETLYACEVCGDSVVDVVKIPRGQGCYDRVCRDCYDMHGDACSDLIDEQENEEV